MPRDDNYPIVPAGASVDRMMREDEFGPQAAEFHAFSMLEAAALAGAAGPRARHAQSVFNRW
ncbi:hypothetical protein [Reyranella sp. CPCC 100927]|uniref:hypothetical protein n=1 Tax=Reyranella sp. CPCC 100927 TaxID=2599616 RepID=UPI0011B505AF|nr:hypothetical protein [Reyranella sp. CPCC 100927]TWT05015.1 hypothetical protein FQU96_25520 [Reyranella sp. CPCC 100927]